MRELHLTPRGTGEDLNRSERRAAWALVGESIRHELAERHAQHWPRYRPSARRILAARFAARRRMLLVVTDGEGAARRIVMTATYRNASAHLGRVAVVPLWLTRICSKGFVIVATAMTLLALYHGRIGIGTLGAVAVLVAWLTSPLVSACRLRLGDRALAARARLFCPQHHDVLTQVMVLHNLGLPSTASGSSGLSDGVAIVQQPFAATSSRWWITRPCCTTLAELYASSGTAQWFPSDARLDRTMLLFPGGKPERRDGCADLIPFKAPPSTRRTFEMV